MALQCGIVGLPNVGKSTLFNALTQTASAQAANYPFCTIEPNIGKVNVPDFRLQKLANIAGSKEIIPVQIEFVDIAGLVRGASKGEGLGNQFLSHIREVDAIINVTKTTKKNWKDEDVVNVKEDLNQEKVGKTFKCVIDRKEGTYFIGRTEFDSPEVDNEVLVNAALSENFVRIGDFAHVMIDSAEEFDLFGRVIPS